MWSAFVTGMAEKATSLIDERDKEIQERIDKHLEKMQTEAAETKKKAQLRRDTLESTARELMSLGVSDVQAATLLQNVGPEGAANMVEKLKEAKQVTPEKIRLALAQVKTSAAPLDEVIAQQTTPTTTEVQAPQMRGAFGLPSRAGKEFAETAKEIETELPDIPTKAQPLDLSVFEEEEEETFNERENKARLKVLDAKTPKEKNDALANLTNILAVKDIDKDKEEDGLKEANVRATLRILDASIKQSIAGPGDLAIYTNPETGEKSLELSNDIDPKVRIQIQRERKKQFDAYVNEHYARSGQVPSVVTKIVSAFLGPELNQMPSVEELRADANAKIAENPAVAQEVRAEFKKLTGQDL
jgi:hypothetical protein